MHLRLIMSDVERSLLEVHELNQALQQQAAVVAGGGGGRLAAAGPSFARRSGLGVHGSAALLALSSPRSQARGPASPVPLKARSRSTSFAQDNGTATADAKVVRYQRGILSRRLLVAQGTLSFNLVRFRSEFQSLFGTDRDTGVSHDQSRALSLTRGSSRKYGFGSFASGLGRLGHRGTGAFAGIDVMATTMREWRLRRTISDKLAADGSVPNREKQESPFGDNAFEEDAGAQRAQLMSQLLQLMRRQERVELRGRRTSGPLSALFTAAGEVLHALYSVMFTSGDELTDTTQYSSLSRDIALLEAPEFEVGLDQKLRTAARMRASYTCLTPHK